MCAALVAAVQRSLLDRVAASETNTAEHLAYRQRCLLLWLRAVVGHPLLKRSPFLFLFLTSYDECVGAFLEILTCSSPALSVFFGA